MYDENIMKLALTISNLSKDPTTKVGCVITNKDSEVLSVGYNKIKDFIPIQDIDYISNNKTAKKYAFIHAEMMALSRLKETEEELNIYITHPSCINCAVSYLLNSNYTFKNVYYINQGSDTFMIRYHIQDALDLMSYKKVNVESIETWNIEIGE